MSWARMFNSAAPSLDVGFYCRCVNEVEERKWEEKEEAYNIRGFRCFYARCGGGSEGGCRRGSRGGRGTRGDWRRSCWLSC